MSLPESLPGKGKSPRRPSFFARRLPGQPRRGVIEGLAPPSFSTNRTTIGLEARRWRKEADLGSSAPAGLRRHFGLCGFPRRSERGTRSWRFSRSLAGGPRSRVRLEPGGVPGGTGGGGRMSAEAADREAATSSRPCTPPQTCWFEFLLEESLLEKHLRKPCPGKRGAYTRRGGGPVPRHRSLSSWDPRLLRHEAGGGGAQEARTRAKLWRSPPCYTLSIPVRGHRREGLKNARQRPARLPCLWSFYCLGFQLLPGGLVRLRGLERLALTHPCRTRGCGPFRVGEKLLFWC